MLDSNFMRGYSAGYGSGKKTGDTAGYQRGRLFGVRQGRHEKAYEALVPSVVAAIYDKGAKKIKLFTPSEVGVTDDPATNRLVIGEFERQVDDTFFGGQGTKSDLTKLFGGKSRTATVGQHFRTPTTIWKHGKEEVRSLRSLRDDFVLFKIKGNKPIAGVDFVDQIYKVVDQGEANPLDVLAYPDGTLI